MQVTIEEQKDLCVVTLDISVETEKVAKAFDKAYREFSNITKVPGFRPGKAPRGVLERFVDQDRLRERVKEIIVTQAYHGALREHNIVPYGEPEADIPDVMEGQPFKFNVTIQVPPHVNLGDTSAIAVNRPIFTVSDKDIDTEVENLRNEYSRLEQAHDRGVQEGDQVITEMKVTIEGEEPPAEPRRSLVRITPTNIPGFNEAVTGQMPDEDRRFTLTYPEDFQDPALAGKQADFEVKVISINQTVLPEVTDEWVETVTSYKTVEELRSAFRANRDQFARNQSDTVTENRILEELVKLSEIAYPHAMLEEEIADDMRELNKELEQRKATFEQYLEATGQTQEQHQERVANSASQRLKSLLIMREMAKKEQIQATDAEMEIEFAQIRERNSLSEEELEQMMADERRRLQIANIIIRRKLRDRLFKLARITDVPASQ